jgi:hypothetical protein
MALSFVQFYWVRPSDPYRFEVSLFWLPAVLSLAWCFRLLASTPSAPRSSDCQQKATVA